MKTNDLHKDNWKVVYVAPRAEKKVAKKLTELGIENYLPINREKRKWSDRMKWVELPMIPGYVFVRPNSIQRDQVLQQTAVLNYVRYNRTDAIVKDYEIKALRSIQDKGYFVEASAEKVVIGDEVVIGYGPFKGLNGTVVMDQTHSLYTILIRSLDLSLRIRVPSEILIKEVRK